MLTRALVLIFVSWFACGALAQAGAANRDRAAMSEARMHFKRGVELYQEGSFDAALAEFQRSNQIAPNYKLLYNLAQVQAERHEYVEAVKLLNRYLQAGGADVAEERKQAVQEDLRKLRQRIAELTVNVNVDGAEVFVNDVAVGRTPLTAPLLVNVGSCRLRVEKAGYVTKTHNLTIAGADRPEVTLKLLPNPVSLRRPAPVAVIHKSDLTPFWISLAATVALGGTGGVMAALTSGANHDLTARLNTYPTDHGAVDSARSKVRTMAALTDGFSAAALLAAGFTAYFLVAPPEQTEVAPTAGVHARLTATPAGLSLSGTY